MDRQIWKGISWARRNHETTVTMWGEGGVLTIWTITLCACFNVAISEFGCTTQIFAHKRRFFMTSLTSICSCGNFFCPAVPSVSKTTFWIRSGDDTEIFFSLKDNLILARGPPTLFGPNVYCSSKGCENRSFIKWVMFNKLTENVINLCCTTGHGKCRDIFSGEDRGQERRARSKKGFALLTLAPFSTSAHSVLV